MSLTPQSNYHHITKYFNLGFDGVGLEGGSRTGKTWDICIFIVQYVCDYQNKKINICRDYLSILKNTTYDTLRDVWQEAGLPMDHFNKSATAIHFNNNIIKFHGISDNPDTVKGLKSHLLWINETLAGITQETVNQLEQRTNEFFIYDYNPNAVESFVFDMELLPGYALHKTTIFDNPFTPPKTKRKILSYAHQDVNSYATAQKAGYTKAQWDELCETNVRQKTSNAYMWKVYGLGMRAAGEDIIFEYQLYTDEDLPEEFDWELYGLDFGYKSDPSGHTYVRRSGNNIYMKELLYEAGYLNKDLAVHIINGGYNELTTVCDTSPAQNVDELIDLDINADGCIKFPGSVFWGISHMQQFNLFVHVDSFNFIMEMNGYKWKKDKQGNYVKNQNSPRVPHDGNDHLIDSARYAATYYLQAPNLEE